jgi:hypothetical protein
MTKKVKVKPSQGRTSNATASKTAEAHRNTTNIKHELKVKKKTN